MIRTTLAPLELARTTVTTRLRKYQQYVFHSQLRRSISYLIPISIRLPSFRRFVQNSDFECSSWIFIIKYLLWYLVTYRHKSLVISNLKNVNVYGHSLLLTPLKLPLCFMSPKRLSIIKTIRSNNQLINAFTHKMDIKTKNKAKKNSVALRYKWIVKNV